MMRARARRAASAAAGAARAEQQERTRCGAARRRLFFGSSVPLRKRRFRRGPAHRTPSARKQRIAPRMSSCACWAHVLHTPVGAASNAAASCAHTSDAAAVCVSPRHACRRGHQRERLCRWRRRHTPWRQCSRVLAARDAGQRGRKRAPERTRVIVVVRQSASPPRSCTGGSCRRAGAAALHPHAARECTMRETPARQRGAQARSRESGSHSGAKGAQPSARRSGAAAARRRSRHTQLPPLRSVQARRKAPRRPRSRQRAQSPSARRAAIVSRRSHRPQQLQQRGARLGAHAQHDDERDEAPVKDGLRQPRQASHTHTRQRDPRACVHTHKTPSCGAAGPHAVA
jgi:hypothetical protein